MKLVKLMNLNGANAHTWTDGLGLHSVTFLHCRLLDYKIFPFVILKHNFMFKIDNKNSSSICCAAKPMRCA